jgi:phospholipid/cholesterol/gamma-HCH transport system substrate-binding protein
MERHANYTLVGAVIAAVFVGLVVFMFWVSKAEFGKTYDLYDIVFVGPVKGLSKGGEVDFNGIQVGEVTKVALDKADPSRVIARARVTSDVPVRADSLASLEMQGVTGVNRVLISAGTRSTPLLKTTVPHGVVPVIHTKAGALSSLVASSGETLQAAQEALNRVNRLLSDENLKELSGAMADLHEVTSGAKSSKQLIANADRAAQSFRKLADSSDELVSGDGKRAARELADAATQIKGVATDARELVKSIRGPAGDFAQTGAPQLTQAINSLQQAADSLNRLASRAEQSPRALISRAPAQQVEVKP